MAAVAAAKKAMAAVKAVATVKAMAAVKAEVVETPVAAEVKGQVGRVMEKVGGATDMVAVVTETVVVVTDEGEKARGMAAWVMAAAMAEVEVCPGYRQVRRGGTAVLGMVGGVSEAVLRA